MQLIEFPNHQGEILRGLASGSKENKEAVIFLHGFERTTIEEKFKNIVHLIGDKAITFRFDFSGSGLSDGNFADITIKKMAQELDLAIKTLTKDYPSIKNITLIAHSLGCCVALSYASRNSDKIAKFIFLAPALNQCQLHRYWFAQRQAKELGRESEVSWDNYRNFYKESDFQTFCQNPHHTTKSHYLNKSYFLESKDQDYQSLLSTIPSDIIYAVQSKKDDKVPYQSNNVLIKQNRLLLLENGDNDLENPYIWREYSKSMHAFLAK